MRRTMMERFATARSLGLMGFGLAVLMVATPRVEAKDREPSRYADEDFEWSGVMDDGQTLEIKGIHGAIKVVRARGERARVSARKSAKRSDPSSVKIEVSENDGDITICARYPRPDGRLNDCRPGDSGQHVQNNDVRVDFEVEVPAGVHVRARTVNGDVDIRDLSRSNVEAATVNGSIDLSTTGWGEASTVNGSIHARIGEPRTEGLEFSTVNGAITLALPDDVDADLRAATVNGTVSSDLPIEVTGKTSRRKINGTIGRGGPRLALETVNGSIELRARSR